MLSVEGAQACCGAMWSLAHISPAFPATPRLPKAVRSKVQAKERDLSCSGTLIPIELGYAP